MPLLQTGPVLRGHRAPGLRAVTTRRRCQFIQTTSFGYVWMVHCVNAVLALPARRSARRCCTESNRPVPCGVATPHQRTLKPDCRRDLHRAAVAQDVGVEISDSAMQGGVRDKCAPTTPAGLSLNSNYICSHARSHDVWHASRRACLHSAVGGGRVKEPERLPPVGGRGHPYPRAHVRAVMRSRSMIQPLACWTRWTTTSSTRSTCARPRLWPPSGRRRTRSSRSASSATRA